LSGKIGPVTAAIGIAKVDGELPSEVRAALVELFERFLRGGGRFEFWEWMRLSAVEQAALAEAGDHVLRMRHVDGLTIEGALVAEREAQVALEQVTAKAASR
jgi:hypothetical protein